MGAARSLGQGGARNPETTRRTWIVLAQIHFVSDDVGTHTSVRTERADRIEWGRYSDVSPRDTTGSDQAPIAVGEPVA